MVNRYHPDADTISFLLPSVVFTLINVSRSDPSIARRGHNGEIPIYSDSISEVIFCLRIVANKFRLLCPSKLVAYKDVGGTSIITGFIIASCPDDGGIPIKCDRKTEV